MDDYPDESVLVARAVILFWLMHYAGTVWVPRYPQWGEA